MSRTCQQFLPVDIVGIVALRADVLQPRECAGMNGRNADIAIR
jgi:hypothetical protein